MKKVLIFAAAAMTLAACHQNPFLTQWDTPYGIPPFDKIQNSDYVPAIKAGIEQQKKEVAAIIANQDAPTFDNVVGALELSGGILNNVQNVLFNVAQSDNSDELTAIIEEVTPMLSSHSDDIFMNKDLYKKVAALYNADQSALTREQQMVLKNLYTGFEDSGIGLSEEAQAELREINAQMAVKTTKISINILAENNKFAEEFGISISAYPTAMTETEDRALRQKMNEAYTTRGNHGDENDNKQLVLDIISLRIRKAQLMGYDNPADFILKDKMAGNHETVDAFLAGIMDAAVLKAKEEVVDMQAIMDEDIAAGKLAAGSKIEPWDWWYYAEKVRSRKYALDENLTKPYFEAGNVRKGIFAAAQTLYGITAEKIEDVPVCNPEVETFKITNPDGSLVGIFTTDYFPRSSKRGGAWMSNYRNQYVNAEGEDVRPIVLNVGNFDSPDENGVALMTIDNVQTAFHEFGHALHGLLSKCTYPSVSGTSVKGDFVEMFSQINENWAFQPELLRQYALHYQTGEVIPEELVQKILNASKFNQGFMTAELCAASILDMKWHELTSIEGIDIEEFEKKVCNEMGLIPQIAPRYRTTYFNHIFASGYCAGYYGYLWAEVLDKDAFAKFEENGVWNTELAKKFKETFLEKGGSEDPMTLFVDFMGREPDNDAFLRGRGLK